jgi:hypothetical protein
MEVTAPLALGLKAVSRAEKAWAVPCPTDIVNGRQRNKVKNTNPLLPMIVPPLLDLLRI